MSVVPTQTAELGRRWLTATVGAAVVAAAIPAVAGGPGLWLHLTMAIVTIAGFTLAALHRWTLEPPVIVALLSVMTVGDTATIDPRSSPCRPRSPCSWRSNARRSPPARLGRTGVVDGSRPGRGRGIVVVSVAAGGLVILFAELDALGLRALAAGGMIALTVVCLLVRGRGGLSRVE